MNINAISPFNFKRVYVSTNMNKTQRRLANQVADALSLCGVSDYYEALNKDVLINRQKDDGICVTLRRIDNGRIFNQNYTSWYI